MFHVPCLLFSLPCGIMVVRQILALNVRVQILAGQQRNFEQGTMNDEVVEYFDVERSLFIIRYSLTFLAQILHHENSCFCLPAFC